MKKQPRLSICIATYNRARFIGETLKSIIPQLTDETELLVVDGASPDNTQSVVGKYAADEPRLRYVRLEKKGGVDQDYCKAVELAEGEFCWLFTDDDLLKPGAVNEVLKRIRDDVSLIIVNAEVANADFTERIEDRRIKKDKDIVYTATEFERLFADAAGYLSFIGGVVIRRSLWMQRDKAKYFGTEFVHVGVIFQAPLPAKAVLVAEPYISIRYGNAQWSIRNFEIWMYKWPRIIWSFDGISIQNKKAIIQREPWRDLRIQAIRRGTGFYSLPEFCNFLSKERINLLWKLGALLIASLPFRIVNAIMIWRYTPLKESNGMLLHDFLLARARSNKKISD
jgi:abequosyltransferase